jgi:hypothetical protein
MRYDGGMPSEATAIYDQAVQNLRSALDGGDHRGHLEAIEALVPLLIQRGQTLASSRLVDEGFSLLGKRGIGLSAMERARLGARFARLWWMSGRRAETGSDPSKYWFFRT